MKRITTLTLLGLVAALALSACEKSEDFEDDLQQKTLQATGDGTNGGTLN